MADTKKIPQWNKAKRAPQFKHGHFPLYQKSSNKDEDSTSKNGLTVTVRMSYFNSECPLIV